MDKKKHWENIFKTKDTSKVSWFQPVPETSLAIIENLQLSPTVKCIDVGCGDSCLPEFLLEKGFTNISAVDISSVAIEHSKKKMGSNAQQVKWFVADITEFNPPEKFDLWHDRAVFHFLTNQADIEKYVQTVENNIARNGYLVIGTFSNNGPDICSGLRIEQYSEKKIKPIFESGFRFINYFTENHQTPSGSQQNFLFTIFQKK